MKKLNQFIVTTILFFCVVLFIQKNSSATTYTFDVVLKGVNEVPPNVSTAVGGILGTYDDVARIITFDLTFNGLLAGTTAAHFHGPAPVGQTAGVVIGFAGFPTGVTSGGYSNTYGPLTVAQNAEIIGGLWYVNVHTTLFPGGEIRAQLVEGTLPVELSSFTANIFKNDVTLNWSTASETNNSGFDVERKLSSSSSWSKVGNVAGNGNTAVTTNYSFSDRVTTGVYSYRLKQIDFNGNFHYYNLSNEVNVGVPSSFSISQNYPNPFNPTTKIDYELPNDAVVSITLFDLSGKEVSKLVNEAMTAGYHTVQVNGSNLSSGVYFYNITAGSFVQTKKMTLIK